MKTFGIALAILTAMNVAAQTEKQDWENLVPLVSSRAEVERILGKPDMKFETFGTYRTAFGRFSVWFSKGGCPKAVEGREWDIPAKRMTILSVEPNVPLPLDSFSVSKTSLMRKPSPGSYSRYHYYTSDESIIYETIRRADGSELVHRINLEPAMNARLLCTTKKLGGRTVTGRRFRR